MTDTSTGLVRVSDAERQFVVDRLRDETVAGRLSPDEFDRRAGRAYTARTRDQLLTLLPATPAEDDTEGERERDEIEVVSVTVTRPRRWRLRR